MRVTACMHLPTSKGERFARSAIENLPGREITISGWPGHVLGASMPVDGRFIQLDLKFDLPDEAADDLRRMLGQ